MADKGRSFTLVLDGKDFASGGLVAPKDVPPLDAKFFEKLNNLRFCHPDNSCQRDALRSALQAIVDDAGCELELEPAHTVDSRLIRAANKLLNELEQHAQARSP